MFIQYAGPGTLRQYKSHIRPVCVYRRHNPHYIIRLCRGDGDGDDLTLHDHAGFGMPRTASALSCTTRPPSALRSRHARPTHQPPKQRAPMSKSASGGQEKAPSLGRFTPSPVSERIRAKRGAYNIFEGLSHPESRLH